MPATDSTANGAAPAGRLRRGAAALKAEIDVLRTEIAELRPAVAGRRDGVVAIRPFGKLADIALPPGPGAPGAARMVTGHCLTGLVSRQVLEDAELLVSELVTNSLKYGELGNGDSVLLRIYLADELLRVEIENPGITGVVASIPRDRRARAGGFGLDLVDVLAARWAVSRNGSTSVWFEMRRA
jgi:hypothetical protein